MMIGGYWVSDLIEIKHYDGKGYQPLVDFNTWRVAILHWERSLLPEEIEKMERHTQTDEVFVLLDGKATLILGGNSIKVDGIHPCNLEKCMLYNVKQDVWHTVLLSRDATILIVENRDTGDDNTEYCPLAEEHKREIIALR